MFVLELSGIQIIFLYYFIFNGSKTLVYKQARHVNGYVNILLDNLLK